MRKRYFVAIVLAVSVALFWVVLRNKSESRKRSMSTEVQSGDSLAESQKVSASVSEDFGGRSSGHSSHIDKNSTTEGVGEAVADYVEKGRADPQYDWKQPINFYGKVVDESNQPVGGASIDFKWTDLSPDGTSTYHTTSDSAGLFSMVNKAGKRLSVSASKAGYYSAGDARLASFEYANPADGLFTPEPKNPVVFHLRKKGVGVDLITSEYGVKKYFGVPAPVDGSPVRSDILERKSGGQEGQIIISKTTPPYEKWKEATGWTFRMEIPGGGFVEQKDEFPFEAPETGYQPVIQFDFQKGETNWATMVEKDYYIRFGSPPRYGRLHLETLIEMQGARLTYAINPTGSRYLEPKS